jgi:hypothetical protein
MVLMTGKKRDLCASLTSQSTIVFGWPIRVDGLQDVAADRNHDSELRR